MSISCLSSTPGDVARGPGLKEFMAPAGGFSPPHLAPEAEQLSPAPYLEESQLSGKGRKGV